jgi:hypothetical protein
MRPLSATEAISPAWNHTRNLFTPRSWKTVLEIGLIAFFAQFSGCNGNFSGNKMQHLPGMSPQLGAALLAIGLVVGFFALVFAFAFFYLNSRLQFVVFEIVLRSDTTIAPMWRRYGPATWRWMGLKLLFFFLALLCLLPILLPFVLHLIHIFKDNADGGAAAFWPVLKQMLGLIFVGFVAMFFILAAYRVLYDFGLPSMALEGTSIGETASRVLRLLRAEPGAVALYALMHFVLSLGMSIANGIILVLCLLVALIPLGGLGAGLWFGLRHSGIVGYVFMGCGLGVLGLIFVALMACVVLTLIAWVTCFMQAYALYFLGGRYPLLGSYLEPEPPPPVFVDTPLPAIYPPPAPVDLSE